MGKGTHFLGQPILNLYAIIICSKPWCQQWHQGFFTQKKRGVKIMVVTSLLIEIKDNPCN